MVVRSQNPSSLFYRNIPIESTAICQARIGNPSGTPGFAGRVLTGSAPLRSASTGTAFGPFPPAGAVGDGRLPRQTGVPVCHGKSLIRRLKEVASLPPVISFCLDWSPRIRGDQSGKRFEQWPRARGVSCLSPSAPGGGTGRVKEKGIAGLRDRSRWSLKSRHRDSFLPRNHREAVPVHMVIRGDVSRVQLFSCQRGDYKGGDGQIISPLAYEVCSPLGLLSLPSVARL